MAGFSCEAGRYEPCWACRSGVGAGVAVVDEEALRYIKQSVRASAPGPVQRLALAFALVTSPLTPSDLRTAATKACHDSAHRSAFLSAAWRRT